MYRLLSKCFQKDRGKQLLTNKGKKRLLLISKIINKIIKDLKCSNRIKMGSKEEGEEEHQEGEEEHKEGEEADLEEEEFYKAKI